MKNIKVELSLDELLLLTTLVSDQLFRNEFIDPKMPGYKGDPADLAMGKEVLARLKAIIKQASDAPGGAASRRVPGHFARNPNGIPDAV